MEEKKYILESKSLLFSKKLRFLREAIEERIDHLFKKAEKILVITSLSFPEEKESFWRNNSKIVKSDFQSFCMSQSLPRLVDDRYFNAVIIAEKLNDNLKKFIIKTFKSFSNIFIALWNDSNNLFQIFEENCQRFCFLNIDDNQVSEVKIIERSLDSKKDKFLLDDRFTREAQEVILNFHCPLVLVSKNEQDSLEIANKRISLLVSELSLSPKEILFFSDYEDNRISSISSFWHEIKEFNKGSLSLIRKSGLFREGVFNSIAFERKYKALIIISPIYEEVLLQELIFRLGKISSNIIWFAAQSVFSCEEFKKINKLFSTYTWGVVNRLKSGKSIHIDLFQKVNNNEQNKELLFSESVFGRKNPFFNESMNEKIPDFLFSDDEDIDGDLF